MTQNRNSPIAEIWKSASEIALWDAGDDAFNIYPTTGSFASGN